MAITGDTPKLSDFQFDAAKLCRYEIGLKNGVLKASDAEDRTPSGKRNVPICAFAVLLRLGLAYRGADFKSLAISGNKNAMRLSNRLSGANAGSLEAHAAK